MAGMLRRIVFFLMLGSALAAQEKKYPLGSVHVDGNHDIPSEKIIEASGLKIGELVVKEDFEAARKRLTDTGAFEMVGYGYSYSDFSGYDAAIHVVEAGPLIPYRFEDLPASDATLRAALHNRESLFGDRIPPVAAVIDRYAKTIQGVIGQPVVSNFNSDSPDDIAIIFRPPTPRSRIAEVRFEGNDALPS